MRELQKRVEEAGTYLGYGIVKVDSFLNHQVDPELIMKIGSEFAWQLLHLGVFNTDKILTAEVSGLAPALSTALSLRVPLVFAKKRQSVTMDGKIYSATAPSRTKGNVVTLRVSAAFLKKGEQIVIVDDFLASGRTIGALAEIVEQSGAHLLAIGCVVEKVFEGGREHLKSLGVPIVSLAKIEIHDGKIRVF